MGMIIAIFGVGANICVYKDENKHAADNGIFYGTILSILIFFIILHLSASLFLFCCILLNHFLILIISLNTLSR